MILRTIGIGLAGLFVAIASLTATAIELGATKVNSSLGQNLDAEIELTAVSAAEISSIEFRVAPPEAFREAGIPYLSAFGTVRVLARTREDGRCYLKLISKEAFEEPAFQILLEVVRQDAKARESVSLLLDPAPDSPRTYGPVRRGETLRGIAASTKPTSMSVEQMIVAIFRDNPSAFTGRNMNHLRTGAILNVPSAQSVSKISHAEASGETRSQATAWKAYRDSLATGAASIPSPSDSAFAASGRIASAAVTPPAPPSAEPKDVLKLSKSDSVKTGAAAHKGGTASDRVMALQEERIAKEKALGEAMSRQADLEKQIADLKKMMSAAKPKDALPDAKMAEAPKVAAAAKARPKAAPPPMDLTDEFLESPLSSLVNSVRDFLFGGRAKESKQDDLVKADKAEKPLGMQDLRWNVWMAELDSPYSPVSRLAIRGEPGAPPYLLTADLTFFGYTSAKGEVRTVMAPGTGEFLETTPEESPTLQAFLLVDEAYLEVQDSRWKPVTVAADKLKPLREGRAARYHGDAFAALRGNPSFRLATMDFRVRPKKEGWARISVAFFARGRFVEEINTAFCIGSTQCAPPDPIRSALGGFKSIQLSGEAQASVPDAALYLLEFPSYAGTEPAITGVLSVQASTGCSRQLEPIVWQLTRREDFKASLDAILSAIEEGRTEDSLQRQGIALSTLLFPGRSAAGSGAARAYDALRCLAGIASARRQATKPSLFARMILKDSSAPAIVPLGLMALELGPRKFFLADSVRLELPLQNQHYSPTQSCQQTWVVVLPPEGGDDATLAGARGAVSDEVITDWRRRYDLIADNSKMDGLAKWLNTPEEKENRKKVGLLVLSHHDRDALYFDSAHKLTAVGMKREFARPSFAILNACRTVANTGNGFVRQLDEHHIDAVIASLTNADAVMAGTFFACFAAKTKEPGAVKGVTISELFDQTIRCVYDQTAREAVIDDKKVIFTNKTYKYGPNAYKYTLLGNGNLRVCLEQGASQ